MTAKKSAKESSRATYYVTPHASRAGAWAVKREHGCRPSSVHAVKTDAILRATELAKATGRGSVIIQRADGTIQDERTYGADPFPPRG